MELALGKLSIKLRFCDKVIFEKSELYLTHVLFKFNRLLVCITGNMVGEDLEFTGFSRLMMKLDSIGLPNSCLNVLGSQYQMIVSRCNILSFRVYGT